MLDPQLLALLVCPATHQDVVPAAPEEVIRLNEAIRLGRLKTVGGKAGEGVLDGALVRQDGAVAYPVRDGIPVMLVEEALVVTVLDLQTIDPMHGAADGSPALPSAV